MASIFERILLAAAQILFASCCLFISWISFFVLLFLICCKVNDYLCSLRALIDISANYLLACLLSHCVTIRGRVPQHRG